MGNFSGFQKSDDFYIHPCLGQIKRIQKEDGPQLIQFKVLVESEDAVQLWLHKVQKLNNSLCQNILFLPKTHYFQKIGYCGQNGQVFLLFDDYMFSLKDEIKNRRIIKRAFAETSIWEILNKLIKAQSFLKKENLTIGNVNPSNIIVNQQGDIRILSEISWPGAENNTFDLEQHKKRLCSPEAWSQTIKINSLLKTQPNQNLLQSAKRKQMIQLLPKFDRNASQIFSIGMTLLEICSLQDSQQIYQNERINQNLIFTRISQLNKKYSNGLVNIIWQMLKINTNDRIKIQQLQNILAPHQTEILNHQKFVLTHQFNQMMSTVQVMDPLIQNKIGKQKKDRWARFANFFPFLREVPQSEKGLISNISIHKGKATQKPNIRLATAR